MKAVHLDVEHQRTGERKRCEYVETLASGIRRRRRARARAVVVRWPNGGGIATFCLASGWDLPGGETWRLTADARDRARKLAAAEGLDLPEATSFVPHVMRARARAAEEQPPTPATAPDPRQERLPF